MNAALHKMKTTPGCTREDAILHSLSTRSGRSHHVEGGEETVGGNHRL